MIIRKKENEKNDQCNPNIYNLLNSNDLCSDEKNNKRSNSKFASNLKKEIRKQNPKIAKKNLHHGVDHFSKKMITFKKKKLFITCKSNAIHNISKENFITLNKQNFANNEIIESSIDSSYKDFENNNTLLQNYYSSFADLTNKKEKNFDIIEKKCINLFKNRIFDLKLILCAKIPTPCQKELFDNIISKMKHVLKFFNKEDYYKLFYKIIDEFLTLDLSYLHFIRILECYFCLDKLEKNVEYSTLQCKKF